MTILLVDDNEINLEIQKLMLEGCGLSVRTAGSGLESIQMAGEHLFGLILMDIQMPGMNGYEAAEKIRERDPEVPIYALSADQIDQESAEFRKSGMNGALLKPLQAEEVQSILSGTPQRIAASTAEPVFGYEELKALLSDEKALQQILWQFLSVHEGDCEALVQKVHAGDFLGARRILHNIRGISGNMFCRRLFTVSRTLSKELKLERSDSLDTFSAVWDVTIQAIREHCPETSPAASAGNHAAWPQLREHFMSLCRDFDITATDLFAENTPVFAANLPPERFAQLQETVLRYDYLTITEQFPEL